MNKSIVIIGGGISGLSAALIFGNKMPDAKITIIEPNELSKGHTATRVYQTGVGMFMGDIGGHFFHHDNFPQIFDLLPGIEQDVIFHKKTAIVKVMGEELSAPLQATYAGHSNSEFKDLVAKDLAAADQSDNSANLFDMLMNRYGPTLFEKFFAGYNSKMYNLDSPYDMKNIPISTQEKTINTAIGKKMYNADFFYPKSGGINTLTLRILDEIKKNPNIEFIKGKVKSITTVDSSMGDSSEKLVYYTTSPNNPMSYIPADYIVNTSSLKLVEDWYDRAPKAFSVLKHSKGLVINVGVKANQHNTHVNWGYYPDEDFVYRAGSYSSVCKSLAPEGYSSLYIEIKQIAETTFTEDEITGLVKNFLVRNGWMDVNEEPLYYDFISIPNNYPFYHPNNDEYIELLEGHNIYSVGRWATWKWKSMHNSFIDAEKAVEAISSK